MRGIGNAACRDVTDLPLLAISTTTNPGHRVVKPTPATWTVIADTTTDSKINPAGATRSTQRQGNSPSPHQPHDTTTRQSNSMSIHSRQRSKNPTAQSQHPSHGSPNAGNLRFTPTNRHHSR